MTLNVIRYGEFNDPMMGHRIAYSAEGQINRKEYGLTFDMMLDGKYIVSDEIQIMIEGELIEQKQEQAAGATSAEQSRAIAIHRRIPRGPESEGKPHSPLLVGEGLGVRSPNANSRTEAEKAPDLQCQISAMYCQTVRRSPGTTTPFSDHRWLSLLPSRSR